MDSEVREKIEEVFDILGNAPELNLRNFNIEEVEKLNSAVVCAYNILDFLLAEHK
jgi:hypothetical protein